MEPKSGVKSLSIASAHSRLKLLPCGMAGWRERCEEPQPKRLRERGVFSETRWKLARPIAGRENNRHAPTAKQVCDRIHYGPADIHIQDRGIEAGVRCKAKSLPHCRAGPTTSLPKSSTISSTSIA